jgi:hypothetical protein
MLDDINQSGAYRPCKGRIANGFINSEVHSINFALPAQAAPSLFIRHLGATERVPDALELRFRVARVAENTLPGPRVEGSVLAGAEHNLPAITPPRNLQLDSLADETTASGGEMCTFNQLINSPAEGSDNLGLRETPQPDSPPTFSSQALFGSGPMGEPKTIADFLSRPLDASPGAPQPFPPHAAVHRSRGAPSPPTTPPQSSLEAPIVASERALGKRPAPTDDDQGRAPRTRQPFGASHAESSGAAAARAHEEIEGAERPTFP